MHDALCGWTLGGRDIYGLDSINFKEKKIFSLIILVLLIYYLIGLISNLNLIQSKLTM